jgi:hypothetical protein
MLDLTTLTRRIAFGLALVWAPAVGVAGDIPEAVKVACSNDCQKHCIKHEPGSDSGRECMADVFEKLSETCVAAIMNSDLVGEEPDREAAETAAADAAMPPTSVRRVAAYGTTRKTRTTRRAATSRSGVGARRTASRSARRRTYASRQGRISGRVARWPAHRRSSRVTRVGAGVSVLAADRANWG